MTTRSLLARPSRRVPLLRTSSALVVALLLLGLAPFAAAGAGPGGGPATTPGSSQAKPPTVEGTVWNVNGPIIDLVEGGLQIDVTNATITGGDDRYANLLPWSGILVGARIVAQVSVPDVLPPTRFPQPPLVATSVVVTQTRGGVLSGTIQAVDVASGKFTMLIRTVSVNASTAWFGGGSNGAVKGIADLSAGMFATVSVVNSGGLLATSVDVQDDAVPALLAFRSAVQTITPTLWTISGRTVLVNSDTKIIGDPKPGDTVDVVARVYNPPAGSMAPSYLVALSITKALPLTAGPGTQPTEFDGVVDSIPVGPAVFAPWGHWEITGSGDAGPTDVLVNRLTHLDKGIKVGSNVHVTGFDLLTTNVAFGGQQFVATSITLNN
jgi:hypothetical protein